MEGKNLVETEKQQKVEQAENQNAEGDGGDDQEFEDAIQGDASDNADEQDDAKAKAINIESLSLENGGQQQKQTNQDNRPQSQDTPSNAEQAKQDEDKTLNQSKTEEAKKQDQDTPIKDENAADNSKQEQPAMGESNAAQGQQNIIDWTDDADDVEKDEQEEKTPMAVQKQDEQTPAQDGQQQNEEENGGLEPINYELFDLEQAMKCKDEGNELCKKVQRGEGTTDDTVEAIRLYGQAVELCPPDEKKQKAIFHNNLGIAYTKLDKKLQAKGEFSKAIELNPEYAKPLYHRMNLYKGEEEYEAALGDAQKILEVDPSFSSPQLQQKIIPELERLQKEKFEKMKDEVVGNLKQLGNSVLGYFGMSTDNFKMQQNADGTYNMNYQP